MLGLNFFFVGVQNVLKIMVFVLAVPINIVLTMKLILIKYILKSDQMAQGKTTPCKSDQLL